MNNTFEFLINKILDGSLDPDGHNLFLFSLVVGSKAKTIIELGVREGNTTVPLVLGAKRTNGMVYSVDINPTPLKLDEDLQKHNTFFHQDAIVFLSNWDPNQHIDIVFVDDWHAYEHVKKELEILSELVSPKTVILLHDLMYFNTCPYYHSEPEITSGEWTGGGPYKAVAELDPQQWEWSTLPWGHGMTILRKKAEK